MAAVKILSYDIARGGTELVAFTLYCELIDSNEDVELLIYSSKKNKLNIKAKYLKNITFYNKNFLKYFFKVLIIGNSKKNNSIIIFSEFLAIFIGLIKYFKIISSGIFIRSSTIQSRYLEKKGKLRFNLSKIAYKNATKIITQSNFMQNDIKAFFEIDDDKLIKIFNPNIRNPFKNYEEKKLTNLTSYILVIGNFRKEKGHLRLLNHIAESNFYGNFIFAGSGELENEIKSIIHAKNLESNITVLNNIFDTSSLIRNCSALLIPSYYEGFPNVALDALRYDKPLIGYDDCKVLFEIIKPNLNGLFIKSDGSNFESKLSEINDFDFNKEYNSNFLYKHSNINFIRSFQHIIHNLK